MEDPADSKRTLHAFIPSKLEAIIIPIAVFLFLLLANSMTLLQTIDGKNYPRFTEYLQVRAHNVLDAIDRSVGPRVPLILFWMTIGIIVYVICWFTYSAYSTYKSDVRSIKKGMIAPANYNESKAWHENLARFLTRLIAAVLLVFWLYLLLTQMLPNASNTFLQHMADFSIASIPHLVLSVGVISLAVFAISVLARCIVLRDRVFVS